MTMTLEALQGRVMDVDSHEMMPVSQFEDYFGDRGRRFVEASEAMFKVILEARGPNNLFVDVEDTMEITPETVWTEKGPGAPSAIDFSRRPEVLDMMGVRRQLVYPGFGGLALIMAGGHGGFAAENAPNAGREAMKLGWEAIDAHNEWAAEITNENPDRVRMVGVLGASRPDATPQSLAQEAEQLIDTGLRAFFVSSGVPPAGVSPADRALDPFYAALAEANAALTFHVGGGHGFRSSDAWGRVPAFRYQYHNTAEHAADPFSLCGWHMAEETYLAAMTLGGVFERHPTLRVGAIEVGASWIGPLAERMDFLADKHSHLWDGGGDLSMRPSEYLARNVRVTPLNYEPVEVWLERYPMLQDVLCFSTDYPHLEGGKQSLQRVYERLAPLGDDIVEKYFCTNGELLLP
jgi:predicted TIM-barrel fold metal-dependent hydrolase